LEKGFNHEGAKDTKKEEGFKDIRDSLAVTVREAEIT
jgi:hypothetical protein